MNKQNFLLAIIIIVAFGISIRALPHKLLNSSDQKDDHNTASSVPKAMDVHGVPAFHHGTPRNPLPATVPADHFSDREVRCAYTLAAQIKVILYQEPCYCYCDRMYDHHSLLDCFVGKHASLCEICQEEVMYVYRQHKEGKTPSTIRKGLIRGDWKKINAANCSKASD